MHMPLGTELGDIQASLVSEPLCLVPQGRSLFVDSCAVIRKSSLSYGMCSQIPPCGVQNVWQSPSVELEVIRFMGWIRHAGHDSCNKAISAIHSESSMKCPNGSATAPEVGSYASRIGPSVIIRFS